MKKLRIINAILFLILPLSLILTLAACTVTPSQKEKRNK